jgi:pyridoxine 5-phosphate synthase
MYTGASAAAVRTGAYATQLAACSATAAAARDSGLRVNAGHDLNLHNLPPLIEALPGLAEVSIGHELTADALVTGLEAAVKNYKTTLAC